MPIHQITPEQAKEILDEDPNAVYVDVRSIPEFTSEHPAGAINIPILHKDEVTGGMAPNPEFLQVAQAALPKDKKLLVGCLRGPRSQRACEILAANGYEHVSNIQGGFGGAIDPATGQIGQQGWKELGLPTSTDNGEGVSYESLRAKVK